MQTMDSRGFGTVFDRSGSVTQPENERTSGSPAIRCKETSDRLPAAPSSTLIGRSRR